MGKSTQTSIRLELNDRILFEIKSGDFKDEITIGRSAECTWQIPATDKSASNKHARIFKKGGKFILQDTQSRNGVFYMGQRISEQKLNGGEIYGIGDCKLIVETIEVASGKKGQEQYHRLEQLSGEERGKMIQLKEPECRIGSSPDSEIYIPDAHVSHMHAVIENKNDGTCWIKDKGSRNGTKINGVLLTKENADTGRMLKDGDVISITYIDYKFWDKNVVHVRSHLMLKAFVVFATLAVAIGGYLMVRSVFPSAKELRVVAEQLAADCRFEEARQMVEKAAEARGADLEIAQREDLLRKLTLWEKTYNTWGKIKKGMSANNMSSLQSANGQFAALLSANNENWKWNSSSAAAEMKAAQESQELLNNLLTAEDRIQSSEDDMDALRKLEGKLATSLAQCKANPLPYREFAVKRSEATLEELRLILGEYAQLQKLLDEYSDINAVDHVLAEIANVKEINEKRIQERKSKNLPVSYYISHYSVSLLDPIKMLQESNNILTDNFKAVSKLDFASYKAKLPLPSAEQSQISSAFAARSLELEKSNEQLGKIIVQLKNYYFMFTQNHLMPEMNSELLNGIFNDAMLQNVLRCDCLDAKMPTFSIKEPTSDYDRLLGVGVFYEYIRSLGGEFDTVVFDDRFEPDIFKAKSLFGNMNTFLDFCKGGMKTSFQAEMKRLMDMAGEGSQLASLVKRAEDIRAKRRALMQKMLEMYEAEPNNRRGIIAGGIVSILHENKDEFVDEDFDVKLQESVKALRKRLNDIEAEKNGSNVSAETIIACERRLLLMGIPGDALLKQPWTDKFNKKN